MKLTIDGQRLTDARIRRGLRVNIAAGSLGMAGVAMAMGVPLTMLLEALGANGKQLGLVVTGMQIVMLAQVPSAFIAERLETRKTYWATMALLHRMFWFAPALLPMLFPHSPVWAAWGVILAMTISSLLAHGSAASWYSWMADLVPGDKSGRFWGVRQSVVTSFFLLAMWLSGWVLDQYRDATGHVLSFTGFTIVFAMAALLGMADIIVHLWVPEPVPTRPANFRPPRERLLAPLRQPGFGWLTAAMAMWYFSVGLVGAFGIVYLKRDFQASYTQLSALNIASSLGTIFLGIPAGYLIDRLGARAFGAICLFLGPMFGLVWFFVSPTTLEMYIPLLGTCTVPQPVVLILCTNLLAGGIYAGVGLTQINLANTLAPQEGRTVAMAVHWSIVGVVGAAGPLVGGIVMDYLAVNPLPWILPFGAHFSFFHVLVILHVLTAWLLCVPLLLRIRGREGEPEVGEALMMMGVRNPFRAIINAYNIYQVSANSSSQSRARAARRLGESRMVLAVGDLIDKLDDPSPTVREEAALALGSIGSQEAVEALIEKLDDPHTDLQPQIARALGESGSPLAVEVLLRHLDDGHLETQREAVRALGRIGDSRAIAKLRGLLRATKDDRLVLAAAEALAQLRVVAAVYDLLPRLRATANPLVKQALTVSLADLLGEPGEFYQVLTTEKDEFGVAAERLFKETRRHLRGALPREAQDQLKPQMDSLTRLQEAYEERNFANCPEDLLSLALAAAQFLQLSPGHEADARLGNHIARDEQVAAGIWFLVLLRQEQHQAKPGQCAAEMTDIVLGVYVVARMVERLSDKRAEAEAGDDEH